MWVPDVGGVRRALATRGVQAEPTSGEDGVSCLDPDGNAIGWIEAMKPGAAV